MRTPADSPACLRNDTGRYHTQDPQWRVRVRVLNPWDLCQAYRGASHGCRIRTASRAARPRRGFRSPYGIDVDREPERARRVYDSHLARAASLVEIPYFAQMFQMAPYLWG